MISSTNIIKILSETNFWGKKQDIGIARPSYLSKIKKLRDTPEAIAITGVRRSGKTTIAKQYLAEQKPEQTLYVNFEEPAFTPYLNLDLIEQIYNTYRERINPVGSAHIVLDEVQNITAWEKWVRSKQEKVKIIVTGSSSKLLSSEFSTVLSGRSLPLSVYPLSFKEFLGFKNVKIEKVGAEIVNSNVLKSSLREYLKFGGFPRVVLSNKEIKRALLKEYFEAIVLRDVASRYEIKNIALLKALATLLLTNTSSMVSIGKLAEALHNAFRQRTSLETVSKFLQYFESAYLIFLVPIFSYKAKEQLQYPRKLYCIDAGLHNIVGFKFSEDIGKLAENVVFLKLKRDAQELFYWKDSKGKEVDFVVKKGLKVNKLIQVSWDLSKEKTKKREVSALLSAMHHFGLKTGYILNSDISEEERIEGKIVKYIPLYEWLL